MNRNMLRMAALITFGLSHAACSAGDGTDNSSVATVRQSPDQLEEAMQITIRAGEKVFTAQLDDSAAGRDFAALLPLRLTLKDYASTEKIADLPRELSTSGAPAGFDPSAGDIAYYKPWGNLAVFYRDGHHSPGLVRLGRIKSGMEELASLAGPVVIEAAP